MKVSVAVVVPLAGREKAPRVQVISSVDVVPQVEEDREPEPAKPSTLVKRSVVEADWPGAGTVTVAGLAVTSKVGTAKTV